ncbi:MAG TPA: RNA 2'-phosphotransferase [Gemmatimonadaceae bacterium]|nr:RNA 2'-phosphotransferase [Gemmatimonadaceae bacterium]
MDRALVRVSKFLSLVLRHDPSRVGLELDAGGWVDVEDLLRATARAGLALDRATLQRVIAENDKQRFALSPDGVRIRASQGHSVPVDLGLRELAPPAELFHGTADRFLAGIRREGLRAGSRNHVHLSADEATARQVGQRHGRPVVLRVDAAAMHAAGHRFWRSDNGVWLAERVPVEFLSFPC